MKAQPPQLKTTNDMHPYAIAAVHATATVGGGCGMDRVVATKSLLKRRRAVDGIGHMSSNDAGSNAGSNAASNAGSNAASNAGIHVGHEAAGAMQAFRRTKKLVVH